MDYQPSNNHQPSQQPPQSPYSDEVEPNLTPYPRIVGILLLIVSTSVLVIFFTSPILSYSEDRMIDNLTNFVEEYDNYESIANQTTDEAIESIEESVTDEGSFPGNLQDCELTSMNIISDASTAKYPLQYFERCVDDFAGEDDEIDIGILPIVEYSTAALAVGGVLMLFIGLLFTIIPQSFNRALLIIGLIIAIFLAIFPFAWGEFYGVSVGSYFENSYLANSDYDSIDDVEDEDSRNNLQLQVDSITAVFRTITDPMPFATPGFILTGVLILSLFLPKEQSFTSYAESSQGPSL